VLEGAPRSRTRIYAQKITDAVDEVRKEGFAKADVVTRKKIKKKRGMILKREKQLDEEARETLKTLMTENERLYQAYLLKKQALDIFNDYFKLKILQVCGRLS